MTRISPCISGAAFAAAIVFFGPACNSVLAQSVPTMTVKIYNNSPDYNIYPVLTTGTALKNLWLQAWFKVPKAQLGNNPYPKLTNFRIYVNPTGTGIPPGGSVTLTLPLLTQLVANAQIDPTKPDQFIDWWGGGRVEIFDAPVASGRPPAALTALYTKRKSQSAVTPINGAQVPSCQGCNGQLTIFRDTGGVFGNNEPSQLTEYTLGAINQTSDPFTINTQNVDIDVSYVDTAYLPAAMAPYDTTLPPIAQVGYVGSPQPISTFRAALQKFVANGSPYAGWPQFINNQNQKILKVPSLLHIYGGTDKYTPKPWRPIDKITSAWMNCIKPGSTTPYCNSIKTVRQMFVANYNSYRSLYGSKCDKSKQPVVLTEPLMIQHVYGFTPFIENCPDPTANLLENTPGYSDHGSARFHQVKDLFDKLNYLPNAQFNPYVGLIHSKQYANIANAYAYSVDDAVGNLQADGTGFIIAVGGTKGLPNPTPATPPINVNFGYAKTDAVRYTKYGICTTTPNKPVNPDFPSFGLNIQPK